MLYATLYKPSTCSVFTSFVFFDELVLKKSMVRSLTSNLMGGSAFSLMSLSCPTETLTWLPPLVLEVTVVVTGGALPIWVVDVDENDCFFFVCDGA